MTLKNKTTLYGILLPSPLTEDGEIKAWRFVSNNNAKEHQQTEGPELEQTVLHRDIDHIENL